MNRKYFIRYPRNFANEYDLAWCYDVPVRGGWQRITRGEALFFAKREAARRREDPAFAGYASTMITPIDYTGEPVLSDYFIERIVFYHGDACHGWRLNGRIVCPVED